MFVGAARILRLWTLQEYGVKWGSETNTKTTPKVHLQGVPSMFVGYAIDHPADCYCMLDPKMKGVHET
jgi:hypothetical protein